MSESDDAALAAAVEAANATTPNHGAPSDAPVYDPTEHTVPEVAAYLEQATDAERQRVLAAEAARTDREPRTGVLSVDVVDQDDDGPVTEPAGDGLARRELLPDEQDADERALAPLGDDEPRPDEAPEPAPVRED